MKVRLVALSVEPFIHAFAHLGRQGIMAVSNSTFDCVLHVETEMPKGDKSDERYDALSLMIVELNFSTPSGAQMEVNTFGHEGHRRRQVG